VNISVILFAVEETAAVLGAWGSAMAIQWLASGWRSRSEVGARCKCSNLRPLSP